MAEDFFSETIGFEPEVDFEDIPKINIKNGSPKMIDKILAIRQWITKFCMTEKDVYPLYHGTGFGTRFRKLYGRKRIGYGYEESEIERDFKEGLPLCPAISAVTSFEISKVGKVLNIKLQVELFNGEQIDIDIEKAYIIK